MKFLNKRLQILTAGLLAVAAFSSCQKDKLDPVPQTSLTESEAFSTAGRIRQEVFGVYSAVKNGNFLGGRGLVYQDVRGEDWVNATGNGVTALGVWNFSVVSSDNQVEGYWTAGYTAINRANLVLEGIDANAGLLSPTQASQFKGEMRFLRAVTYFYLVNIYGRRPYNADGGASPGLPLRLKANRGVLSDSVALARSTVAQVYDQIIQDLDFAEANLPATYGTANDSNLVRAHVNSAIAFKTRVYMHMGRYADVIREANKIVSLAPPFVVPNSTTVQHRLEPNILTVFRNFTSAGNRESIFSLPMAQTNPPGTQNGLALYHNAEFSLNTTASGILSNAQFSANDARRTQFVVPGSLIRYSKFNDDNNNYVPIIRYAEVLLNLAEAIARTTPAVDARALSLLNAVQQRSGGTVSVPLTNADLLTAILTERRIEFLGEGLRALDIMRLVLPFPAKPGVSGPPTLTSINYVWPIPASELLYNRLMTPNQ